MHTVVAVSVRPYPWKTNHSTSQEQAEENVRIEFPVQLMFGNKAINCPVNSADVGAAPTMTPRTLERSYFFVAGC